MKNILLSIFIAFVIVPTPWWDSLDRTQQKQTMYPMMEQFSLANPDCLLVTPIIFHLEEIVIIDVTCIDKYFDKVEDTK